MGKDYRLVESSNPTEGGGSLPFLTAASRNRWGFVWVAPPNGKNEQMYGLRLTQNWGCEALGAKPVASCKGEYDLVKLDETKWYLGDRSGDLCKEDVYPEKLQTTALIKK